MKKTDDPSICYKTIQIKNLLSHLKVLELIVLCFSMNKMILLYNFAKQYINLVTDPYRVVWWKLFKSPDAKKWGNILTMVELIFAISFSNGHVERC